MTQIIKFKKKTTNVISGTLIKKIMYKGHEYYYILLSSGKKQYINKKFIIEDENKED